MATAQQRDELLTLARQHYEADMLIKGTYGKGKGDDFKGCSIGCFAHSIKPGHESSHSVVAEHFGYPLWLAYLQDTIFEGLPNGESAKWHVQFAETLHELPDGYDWQRALHRVHAAILRIAYRTAGSAQEVVQRVLDLLVRRTVRRRVRRTVRRIPRNT